jgi:uncharacterized repeat protein (TIGR03803 family)
VRASLPALFGILLVSCSQGGVSLPLIPAQESPSASSLSASGGLERLHSFAGKPDDGGGPSAPLLWYHGTFYGTTQYGGANNRGSIFSLSTSGKESVLYSFGPASEADGATPAAGLTERGGAFYGTTQDGGSGCAPLGCGTVFKIEPSGGETVLHAFQGGSDGEHPTAGLIDVGGTLYGATAEGGGAGHACCGTIFTVSASDAVEVIYRFKGDSGDGNEPLGTLVDLNGELYGTTKTGGAENRGTVFAASTSGSERVLYSFKRKSNDGAQPFAGLIAVQGRLYGTTRYGGGNSTQCLPLGCGTVFETTASGAETVLYRFEGGRDGFGPTAALAAVKNALYGTTQSGGSPGCAGGVGCGTLFEISGTHERRLYTFAGGRKSAGAFPEAGMILENRRLYGTTFGGGVDNFGSAFSFRP